MITLSNGHSFQYMVASGALSYDGRGWLWEWPLRWFGRIQPELFTVVTKSLTLQPTPGNINWLNPLTYLPFSPWSCVRFMPGGVINKVGLTNPGIEWWCRKHGLRANKNKIPLVCSLFGKRAELVEMALMIEKYDLVGIELNPSCPNTGHGFEESGAIVDSVRAVAEVSRFPIIVKLSVAQDYLAIVKGLRGVAQAVSLNSVPYEIAFPEDTEYEHNPIRKLVCRLAKSRHPEFKVGTGGGVSGKPAQLFNWQAVKELAQLGAMHVIAPSIMEYGDLDIVKSYGAAAFSFGAIHLKTPTKPTSIVKLHMTNERHKKLQSAEEYQRAH